MWTTRPNFWTFKKTPQKFARFGISSDLGVTEIFKRINVKNILPYFPRLGKDFFHPSSRPILAFGAPTFRAGQGIQKLRQSPTNASNMNDSEPGSKLGGVFHMFEKHWNLNVDPYKFMISNISSPSKFWYFRQLAVTELFETFHHWSLAQKNTSLVVFFDWWQHLLFETTLEGSDTWENDVPLRYHAKSSQIQKKW